MALNTVQAVVVALANRLQDAEDVGWAILQQLSDPTFATVIGKMLDILGARVGEKRQGRSDVDYQAAIRLRIRVNRSRGKAEDVIAVAVLAAINSTPIYNEFAGVPATFEVDITNLPGAAQVAKLLGKTKMAGTTGNLAYSADALDAFEWGDATDATNTNTAEQWADSVGSTGPAWPAGVSL